MRAASTHPFVARKEKRKRRRIQIQFLVEGEGVQQSSLLKMQAVELYKICFWSIECSDYVGRKSVMLTIVTQGKSLLLGYRELVGRQQQIQDCVLGEAGLRQQAQLENLTKLFEQLVSTEQVRRHRCILAY